MSLNKGHDIFQKALDLTVTSAVELGKVPFFDSRQLCALTFSTGCLTLKCPKVNGSEGWKDQ